MAIVIRNKPCFFGFDLFDDIRNCFIVKIYVGNGGEKTFDNQLVGIFCYKISVILCCMGKSDKGTGKLVLKDGGICLFSAYTGPSCAGLTSCGL